jgi:integrase/recombinase XerD
MTGTDLQIIRPKRNEIAGADAERLPTLHTTARKDNELVAVWLKSHADSSHHTLRAYERIGHRFIAAMEAAGSGLRQATIDDVQSALEVMRVKIDGTPASAATTNTQVAAVKALLGFAHQVGYTGFNVGPLIKLKKAPRKLAQRIMPEVDIQLLIRATADSRHPDRDRAPFETAYYGGLRISELAALTWDEIIPRENGEVQLAVIDKPRHVLLPADVATRLLALRGGAGQGKRLRHQGAGDQLPDQTDRKPGRSQRDKGYYQHILRGLNLRLVVGLAVRDDAPHHPPNCSFESQKAA